MRPLRWTLRPSHGAALALVGILSIGCSVFSGPPPRAPGSAEDTPAPATSPSPAAMASFSVEERERIAMVDPWVTDAASRYAIDADLIRGMIWVESRFEPRAKSPAGARGLMQLMPQTAAALAQQLGRPRPNPYDPEFNVLAGSHYLHGLLARYRGDVTLALAAYNAGPGNVDRWAREAGAAGPDTFLPPHSREYVRLVLDAKARFEAVYQTPQGPERDTVLVKAERPAPPPIEIPEPPATRVTDDGTPVRWDLDRVESDYQPHAEDPPMGETPFPPRPRDEVRGGARIPEVAPVKAVVESGAATEPAVGAGVLPGVAD